MKNKTIISILPRPIWPPYAGQSRLCYFRSLELRKRGLKTILIEFYFLKLIRTREDLDKISNAFDEVYSIKINPLDFLMIFMKLVFNQILGFLPSQTLFLSSYFLERKFKNILNIIEKHNNETFIHCYSIRTYKLWKIISRSSINFTIDFVDSMTLNLKNKLKFVKSYKKLFFLNEFLRTKNFEGNLRKYDSLKSLILVSKNDMNYFSFKRNLNNYNNINIFESGIGVQPISISNLEIKEKFTKNFGNLLFFGTLSYEPNEIAIEFILKNLLPFLKQKNIKFKLTLAGRNPNSNLINNCELHEEVELIPNPENMNQIIDNSFISLVPIFTGSGQQYKAVESLSRGIPIIISTKAAEALSLKDRVNCFVANNVEEYFKCIITLMNSYEKYQEISRNGLNFINKEFSWKSKVDNLIKNVYKI